jgi:hypothetical protein
VFFDLPKFPASQHRHEAIEGEKVRGDIVFSCPTYWIKQLFLYFTFSETKKFQVRVWDTHRVSEAHSADETSTIFNFKSACAGVFEGRK